MPAPIQPLRGLPEITAPAAGPAGAGNHFGELLGSAIRTVESARQAAAGEVARLLNGESGELHAAALAAQRAELSLELFVQVRNKVVQAYQEIMRMQM
ncbi:MAG: flagellar hook-basal body complex protein FliE [Bryobacteraceae bacterium]